VYSDRYLGDLCRDDRWSRVLNGSPDEPDCGERQL
jgi:hypothetical protein